MSRNLTPATAAQAAATSTGPTCILKIEFGGSVGTKYYSDRDLGAGDTSSALNAACRVVAWGNISQLYRERTVNPIGDCRISLLDPDKLLKGYSDDVEFQRKRVTVYQYFAGLEENDLQAILVGVIAEPVAWREGDATLTFDITDISTRYSKDVGTILKREDFPYLAREDEGRIVPLVFGSVERSPAVCLMGGVITELVRPCAAIDLKLFVADAERFPQNTAIQIRIEDEIIEGSFSGNTFTVTQRGADVVPSATTTGPRNTTSFYDAALSDTDGAYLRYFIRVTDPNNVVCYRRIRAYSGDEHCLIYWPYIRLVDDSIWTIPQGTAYKITSLARGHQAGAKVYLADDGTGPLDYVFLVNDAASKALAEVEAEGRWSNEMRIEGGDSHAGIGVSFGEPTEGWRPIDAALYSVNRNDTSVLGAEHPVTTITFGRHPAELNPSISRLGIALSGVEDAGDGTGNLLEDPADVILELLDRFIGVDAGDIDSASFAAASSDGTQYLAFGFTLTDLKPGLELVADLAFQARCALLWEDGQVKLRFLSNAFGSSVLTLDTGDVVADSLEISRTDMSEIVSEVEGAFREDDEEATVVARDADAEAAYGRNVRRIDLWAYNEREYAETIVNFWLARWKRAWTRVRLAAFLPALKLQRRDVVGLDWDAFFVAGQKGRVISLDHTPGAAVPPPGRDQMDTIGLELELPIWAGCTTGCEVECETAGEAGCFTICEIEAETCWQCETNCETACELAATTIAGIECISYDAGCGGACETDYQGGCAACETACEGACESACQVGCEVSCETGCETSDECAVSDDFNRADEDPLGSPWTLSYLGAEPQDQWALLSNAARVTSSGEGNNYFATRSLAAGCANHFTQAVCTGKYTGLVNRFTDNENCYWADLQRPVYSCYRILKLQGGVATVIGTGGNGADCTLRFESEGNTHRVYANGVKYIEVSDSTHPSALGVGFMASLAAQNNGETLVIDDWQAGAVL